jgi:hypothetical protein
MGHLSDVCVGMVSEAYMELGFCCSKGALLMASCDCAKKIHVVIVIIRRIITNHSSKSRRVVITCHNFASREARYHPYFLYYVHEMIGYGVQLA